MQEIPKSPPKKHIWKLLRRGMQAYLRIQDERDKAAS